MILKRRDAETPGKRESGFRAGRGTRRSKDCEES
jgi:hypothetical protein